MMSFDGPALQDFQKLRDALGKRDMISKNNSTLAEAIGVAADIGAALVSDMKETETDLAQMDHRKKMIPVIISGHDDLHCLNRKVCARRKRERCQPIVTEHQTPPPVVRPGPLLGR